jgi:hypothetical protein
MDDSRSSQSNSCAGDRARCGRGFGMEYEPAILGAARILLRSGESRSVPRDVDRIAEKADKKSGLKAVTLNRHSQPRLPGSVVGKRSMVQGADGHKITKGIVLWLPLTWPC